MHRALAFAHVVQALGPLLVGSMAGWWPGRRFFSFLDSMPCLFWIWMPRLLWRVAFCVLVLCFTQGIKVLARNQVSKLDTELLLVLLRKLAPQVAPFSLVSRRENRMIGRTRRKHQTKRRGDGVY
ncbi:hypothetical protein V8C35DRAFT_290037 [Trichoderma chlorosporum]